MAGQICRRCLHWQAEATMAWPMVARCVFWTERLRKTTAVFEDVVPPGLIVATLGMDTCAAFELAAYDDDGNRV